MRITAVKLMTRKNLGNYEHEEITLESVLSEEEDAAGAVIKLKDFMKAALENNIRTLGEISESIQGKSGATVLTAKNPERVVHHTDKISGAKAEINVGGVVNKDTLENGQAIPAVIEDKVPAKRRGGKATTEVAAPAESTPSENAGGASTVVGSVDTKNVTHVQSATPTATASVAGKGVVTYDSKVKEHRSRNATYIGTTYPKWKPDTQFGVGDSPAKAEYAEKIRTFSAALHGKPFEDQKGNMLDSFKAELESFFGHAK